MREIGRTDDASAPLLSCRMNRTACAFDPFPAQLVLPDRISSQDVFCAPVQVSILRPPQPLEMHA